MLEWFEENELYTALLLSRLERWSPSVRYGSCFFGVHVDVQEEVGACADRLFSKNARKWRLSCVCALSFPFDRISDRTSVAFHHQKKMQ